MMEEKIEAKMENEMGEGAMNKPEVKDAGAGMFAVPSMALAIDGEDGQAIEPAEGDEVEVSVMGVVGKSEGGKIYIKPMSFNGVEAEEEAEPEKEAMVKEASEEDMLGAYRASMGGKMGEEVI